MAAAKLDEDYGNLGLPTIAHDDIAIYYNIAIGVQPVLNMAILPIPWNIAIILHIPIVLYNTRVPIPVPEHAIAIYIYGHIFYAAWILQYRYCNTSTGIFNIRVRDVYNTDTCISTPWCYCNIALPVCACYGTESANSGRTSQCSRQLGASNPPATGAKSLPRPLF